MRSSSLLLSLGSLLSVACAGAEEGEGTGDLGGAGGVTFGVGGALLPGAGGSQAPGAGGYANPGAGGYVSPGAGGFVNPGAGGYVGPGAGGFVNPGAGGYVNPGAGGADLGAGGAGEDNRPRCLTKPSQVISIGDSYMNWGTHTFPADLNAEAGITFRPTYAVGGFSMATGGIGLIPPQFDQAVAQDPDIIAVVMDGGGNDVLIPALGRPDCKNMANAGTVPGCQAIVTDALAAAERLMNKMVDANVRDVIYFFYPRVPQPTALGGSNPNAMLEYALPLVKAFCDGVTAQTAGKGNCWFVDLVPVFQGHTDWFAPGDIHENSTGSKAIAKAVVDVMRAQCIGQPASSGCCRP